MCMCMCICVRLYVCASARARARARARAPDNNYMRRLCYVNPSADSTNIELATAQLKQS